MVKFFGLEQRVGRVGFWILPLAIFAWWVRYYPPGVSLLIFDDDARQHVYWTAKFQDPELFRDDLLTSFISSPSIDPPGYQWLYMLGTKFLDPLPLSQLLTLFLLLVSLMALNLILRELVPEGSGRPFALVLFLFYSLYDSSGGFPRSFAFPSLLWFLYFQLKGNSRAQAVVILLEALFYPPILMNTMAIAGLHLIQRIRKEPLRASIFKHIATIGAGAGLAFAFLIWVYWISDSSLLGSQITPQEAREMPEFKDGGRSEFFQDDLLGFLLFGRSGIGVVRILGFLIILLFMVALGGWQSLRVPRVAVDLICTSLLLFALAHMVLFKLHLPSRYTIYTLPLALILIIGATTGPFWQALRGRKQMGLLMRSGLSEHKGVRWALLFVAMGLYGYIQGHFIVMRDSQVVTVDPVEMRLLAFLRALPKDTLIAGHPWDVNNVPLVSKRKVLVNHELSLPYHTGYYQKIRERLFDVFKAYYSNSWSDVEALVEKYGVNVLVINKDRFSDDFLQRRIYFEPFDSFVREFIKGRVGFVLRYPPRDKICFENERYIVLCMR